MKKLIYSAFFSFLIFLPSFVLSQDLELGNKELLERLQEGDGDGVGETSNSEGYKSFVQNEYSNVYKQLSEIDPEDIEKITRADLNQKRIRLASDLCAQDSRACFLIDKYRW